MKRNKIIPELYVRDLKKSLNFYINILGFQVEYERPETNFAMISKSGGQIILSQYYEGKEWTTGELKYPLGRGINLEIEVENVNILTNALKEGNFDIYEQIKEKWYRKNDSKVGHKEFLVQDPDGYLLRFAESLGNKPILD